MALGKENEEHVGQARKESMGDPEGTHHLFYLWQSDDVLILNLRFSCSSFDPYSDQLAAEGHYPWQNAIKKCKVREARKCLTSVL